jgi:hypothetical protein
MYSSNVAVQLPQSGHPLMAREFTLLFDKPCGQIWRFVSLDF